MDGYSDGRFKTNVSIMKIFHKNYFDKFFHRSFQFFFEQIDSKSKIFIRRFFIEEKRSLVIHRANLIIFANVTDLKFPMYHRNQINKKEKRNRFALSLINIDRKIILNENSFEENKTVNTSMDFETKRFSFSSNVSWGQNLAIFRLDSTFFIASRLFEWRC